MNVYLAWKIIYHKPFVEQDVSKCAPSSHDPIVYQYNDTNDMAATGVTQLYFNLQYVNAAVASIAYSST